MCTHQQCHNTCTFDVIMPMTSFIDPIVSNIMLDQVTLYHDNNKEKFNLLFF